MTTITGTNARVYINNELFNGAVSIDVDSLGANDCGNKLSVTPISGTIDLETKSEIDYLEIYLIIMSGLEISRVNLRRAYADYRQRISPLATKYRDFLCVLTYADLTRTAISELPYL